MQNRKWRSGARDCWWAIVPRARAEASLYPLPWLMGSTRRSAWRSLFEHLEGHEINRKAWKCVRVFLTEAPDAAA